MNRKWKAGCLTLFILICILSAGSGMSYLIYLERWSQQVWEQMPEVRERFINMDQELLIQFPPPQGAVEESREQVGGTWPNFGVGTFVNYKIDNQTLDIRAYYQGLMEKAGWKKRQISGIAPPHYYHDGACINVIAYPNNKEAYTLSIYYDFRKQDFSPKLPPKWFLDIQTFGEYDIGSCPN
jgi:hypothetical protein